MGCVPGDACLRRGRASGAHVLCIPYDNKEAGQKAKSESQPVDVASQGLDALLKGKRHVYPAAKTKIEGMLADAIPRVLTSAMHEKMAKPNAER